jgi:transposase-like protein
MDCFRRKWNFASKEIVQRMGANMAKKRKQYTGEQKLAILRKHLLEGVAVSDICDAHELRPAVFYPQSDGKIERWQKSLKSECSRPTTPLPLQDAQRVARGSVEVYNTVRVRSAIGYVTPQGQAGRM